MVATGKVGKSMVLLGATCGEGLVTSLALEATGRAKTSLSLKATGRAKIVCYHCKICLALP